MDSDFLERIQKMQLTTDEDEAMTVHSMRRQEILEEYSLSLIGKFLTARPINYRVVKNLIRSMWKLGEDLKIVDVGDGLLQFKFSMASQMQWVWNNGPWCFDNQLLALRHWEKGMTVRSVRFTHLPFWVQVWGLPFDLMNEEAGHDIGRGLGKAIEVDCKAFKSNQARFLRVRVELPLDKPLRRGGPVVSPEGDEVRVAFRYERLVGWCYACGKIGHEVKECRTSSVEEKESRPYGEWMKAGSRVRGDTAGGTEGSSRHRQGEPNVQSDDTERTASNKRTINAVTEIPKNQEKTMESPTNTLPNLQQSSEQLSFPCTLQSDPHITEELNIAPSSPINMETENQVSELFSVPVSYELTKNMDGLLSSSPREQDHAKQATHGFLAPGPREQDHAKHATPTATWKKILRPSKISCTDDVVVKLIPVGTKRQSDQTEAIEVQDESSSSKRLKGGAKPTQPNYTTVEAAFQPRRTQ